MAKQILVDMDGVLADVYVQFQKFEKLHRGSEISESELRGLPEQQAFPNGYHHLNTEGFFRDAPVMAGSIEGLKKLNEQHKVYIVSSAVEYPSCLIDKVHWLAEHFPFIHWTQIILCGDKKAIQGDVMIDDHPKNLNHFQGTRIMFTQSHNLDHTNDSFHRVSNWEEILELLL